MSRTINAFASSLGFAPAQAQGLQGWPESEPNAAAVLWHQEAAASVPIAFAQSLLSVFFGLIVESNPVHIAALHAYWSAPSPSFVVLPRTTNEVFLVLKVINSLHLTFSVRSGGHSPNPGWAGTRQPGLVNDLRRINQVAVTDEVVSLGPGALSVIGGRIPSVRVGGGFSHFSSQYGLATDNVKKFEIVLGDGTITDVNADNKPDLFWALKGGGANFGVVARFDLYNIWYEIGQHNCSHTRATVALIVGLDAIILDLIYSEPREERPACFAPFKTIPAITYPIPAADCTVLQLTQILDAAASATLPQKPSSWGASTAANQTFILQPITAAVVKYGHDEGGKCLGLAAGNAQCRGLRNGFVYMGDASRDQNLLASYGEENLERLKAVSLKYDPGQVFQRLQNNGFLLSMV
ncbi:FAD-binding oxidoreductase [Aspergillus undulatus]|uniref:FAD-binding oxidoreductase n=1 Tax=Aspergillus undulatus TaxID=1810928 RepID=UPI003CCD982E